MRKIPTLFVRDWGTGFSSDNGRYVTREVNPGCEWALDRGAIPGGGVATRKWDGTCVLVREDGTLAARREVKAGKAEPPGFVAIEHDMTTGKAVGWEPAEQSGFAKFIAEAYTPDLAPGTYELVGPKINGNPDQFDTHRLVPHGQETLPVDDRSYDGIRIFLDQFPHMEGIVFWRERGNPDAGMVKIKRRDFRPTEGPETVVKDASDR